MSKTYVDYVHTIDAHACNQTLLNHIDDSNISEWRLYLKQLFALAGFL